MANAAWHYSRAQQYLAQLPENDDELEAWQQMRAANVEAAKAHAALAGVALEAELYVVPPGNTSEQSDMRVAWRRALADGS